MMVSSWVLTLVLTFTPMPDPTLLPGVADLPVLAGARHSPDCGGMREVMGPEIQCVTASSERINDLAFAYVAEAKRRGWTDAGGAANALWLERSTADGCERLTVAAFWDFRKHPEYRPRIPGYVGFLVEPARSCGRATP